jgi:hypothetical protein
MSMRFLPVVAILAGFVASQAPASAGSLLGNYAVSGPVAHGNLGVYFVHRGGGGAAQPIALHQAMAQGSARITAPANGFPRIDNLSGQPIFVRAGTLLTGGLQDQAVMSTVIVPPHAKGLVLPTLCVENGRSAARSGDDSTTYTTAGTLLPSEVGTLSLLAGASATPATFYLRQNGVWLAVDSIRSRLSQRLGATIASPRSPSSLPLALENELVDQAQQPFAAALQEAGEAGDISGAVFAIDGRLIAADVYASPALFRQMWPKLVGAYAVHSLTAPNAAGPALPSAESVKAFLEPSSPDDAPVRAVTSNGTWVHVSHASRIPADATGLERTVLKLLATRALDAERAGILTRKQVVDRVLVAAGKEGVDSAAALQQADRAGLFNEPPPRQAASRQGGTSVSAHTSQPTGSTLLPTLVVLMLLLCARRSIVQRLVPRAWSAFLHIWAWLLGPAPAAPQVEASGGEEFDRSDREPLILSGCGHVPLVPPILSRCGYASLVPDADAPPPPPRRVRTRELADA